MAGWITPNLDLVPRQEISSFRKLAIGTWRTAYDPSVYGTLTVRMDRALDYIRAFRHSTGRRLTVTHLIAKACAEALRRCPDANAILRWNKIYLRRGVTVSVLVVQAAGGDGAVDLTVTTIERAHEKNLVQIVDELDRTIERARQRRDRAVEETKRTIRHIPFLLMNVFLRLLSFVMYTLNLDLSKLGLPRDPFGAVTVTNVGSLGLETAYVPLVPYTRTPILVVPGVVRDEPVVEDGKVVPGKVMRVSATFDHRFIDGFHASVLARTVREMLEDPFRCFDRLDTEIPGSR
ncbi:2-oxo acid dehydrogenase subunit E2 [Sorangium sp. So ce375]|uniref:2-oxo acid dehydrogenase subunit E2 n=1 Tax=Sorangium sp. So ce375 TaxID=3133306 RepID=UPI003F5C50AA